VWVLAEIREELERRKHVFVAVGASRFVVMVVVVVARRWRRNLSRHGERKRVWDRGIRSDWRVLRVVAIPAAARKTYVYRARSHVCTSQYAAHSGIRRSKRHRRLDCARRTRWGSHGEIVVGCQGNDTVFDTVALDIGLAIDDDMRIRVQFQRLAVTSISRHVRDDGNGTSGQRGRLRAL
jgi:hypothetical protein